MRRGKTKVVVVLRALACSVAVGGMADDYRVSP